MIHVLELNERGLNFFTNFEKVTGVMPSDYLENDNGLIFLVEHEKLGRAIGKKGANIKRMKDMFRKRVVIIGDSKDPEAFVRSFFSNISITGVEIANVMGDQNIVLTVDEKDRGIAIGKEGERIKAAKEFLRKKFNATIVLRTSRPAISRGVEIDDSRVELGQHAD